MCPEKLDRHKSLANGVFLSTQYIRHYSTPLYTPELDVAHEIIGHTITLADERLAEINRLVGEAASGQNPPKQWSDRLVCIGLQLNSV
ncbi:MAG: hypothetical protein M3388_08180 [Acidobacteriota bacterium]|nr:hypothetical protein [Acidobacteriota bacterium]